MFLGIVTSDGKKESTYLDTNWRKNQCLALPEDHGHQVRPWVDAHYPAGTWVWQQGGDAPSQGAKTTQKMLKEKGHFGIRRTGRQHRLTAQPLDEAIWVHMAGMACRDSAPTLDVLKKRLDVGWKDMDTKLVSRSTVAFWRWLEGVIL